MEDGKIYLNIQVPFKEIEQVIAKYIIDKYLSSYSNYNFEMEDFSENGDTYSIDIGGTERTNNGKT